MGVPGGFGQRGPSTGAGGGTAIGGAGYVPPLPGAVWPGDGGPGEHLLDESRFSEGGEGGGEEGTGGVGGTGGMF